MMPAQPLAGVEQRAGSLKRAIDYVRGGGIVLAAVDGPGGLSTDPVPCLGRRIVLRRGPFVLAGRTGAPVVPAVARWTDEGLLDVIVGAPIASAGENSQAAVVARWLETHLLAHPGDLWPYTIRSLLEAPLA